MSTLFKKLNLKDQRRIVVLDAPESFAVETDALTGVEVLRAPPASGAVGFALAFAIRQQEVEAAVAALLPRLEDDAVLWFAYPKATSKRYRCDFNRDTGWAALGAAGYEGVRMVAIDVDWSALRFRRAEHIKTLRRDASRALSAQGKRRTSPRAAD
jgi:hypothetical protein